MREFCRKACAGSMIKRSLAWIMAVTIIWGSIYMPIRADEGEVIASVKMANDTVNISTGETVKIYYNVIQSSH